VRFENRQLEEWIEQRVSSYFLCYMAAKDVVPVCSGKNFVDVVVKWEGEKSWLIRCFPAFAPIAPSPGIQGMVDMCRVAMVLKARPMIAYVNEGKIDVVWSDRRTGPLPIEKAA